MLLFLVEFRVEGKKGPTLVFRFLVGPREICFHRFPDSPPDDRQLVNPTVRSQEEGMEEPRRS